MLKSIAVALFWIVLIWWVVSNPHTAAQYVHNFFAFITALLPNSG